MATSADGRRDARTPLAVQLSGTRPDFPERLLDHEIEDGPIIIVEGVPFRTWLVKSATTISEGGVSYEGGGWAVQHPDGHILGCSAIHRRVMMASQLLALLREYGRE